MPQHHIAQQFVENEKWYFRGAKEVINRSQLLQAFYCRTTYDFYRFNAFSVFEPPLQHNRYHSARNYCLLILIEP